MEDLRVEYIERDKSDPSYEAIEFDIRDKKTDERYASVWGSELDDLQYDCDHPEHLIEYDEDEATCILCGATSLYNKQVEICGDGYDADGSQKTDYDEGYEYVEWQYPSEPGGFIGEYVKKLERADYQKQYYNEHKDELRKKHNATSLKSYYKKKNTIQTDRIHDIWKTFMEHEYDEAIEIIGSKFRILEKK